MSDVDRPAPDRHKLGLSGPDESRDTAFGAARPAPNQVSYGRWWVLPLLTGTVSAVLLGFLTWQVVVRGPFIGWDWPLHTYVDPRQPSGVGRDMLNVVASLGGQRLYTLPILVLMGTWVVWKQQNIRALVAISAGLATVFFVGYWIKFGLARTAPHTGVDILHGEGQAFPSGHTANATLTWTLIVVILFGAAGARPHGRLLRRWMSLAIAFVFISGMLMTLLDYHWFSDIPGGWLLGALALAVSAAILRAPVPWPALPTFGRSERDEGDGDGR